jgi:hypothetical protein
MPRAKDGPAVKQIDINAIKDQLDRLTARLKDYESDASHCTVSGCKYVDDGLRLSQEVEILRKQNAALLEENAILRARLSNCAPEAAAAPK